MRLMELICKWRGKHEWMISNNVKHCWICGTTEDIPTPEPTPEPTPQPDVSELIRGLMASDVVQMKDISIRKNDLKILKEKGRFNTIYCPIDLAICHDGQGAGVARPHIEAGRTETAITDLAVKNINFIYEQGMRVIVVCGNEPSVRKNWSYLMSGLGFKRGLKNTDLYTSAMLEKEKKCLTDLIIKAGSKIFGIILFLEPTVSSSKSFVRALATHIRAQGYKGRLYSNGIGSGEWSGDIALDVRSAPSQNSLDNWKKTNAKLRNADGMDVVDASTASSLIPQLTSLLGVDGGILYFKDYKGNTNGAQKLQDWMWKYCKW
jgi:hypothetical protein